MAIRTRTKTSPLSCPQDPPDERHIKDLGQWCEKTTSAIYKIHIGLHGKPNASFEEGMASISEQWDRILDMLKSLGAYAIEYSRLASSLVTHPRSENVQYLHGTLIMARGLSQTVADLCGTHQRGNKLLTRVSMPEEASEQLQEAKVAFERVGDALKSLSEYFKQHLPHLESLLPEEETGSDLTSFEDAVARVNESWWRCKRNSETAMSRVSQAADFIVTPRQNADIRGAPKFTDLLCRDRRRATGTELGQRKLISMSESAHSKRPTLLRIIIPCLNPH